MGWETITGILGAIVLIGNAGAVIFKWIRPAVNIKNRVEVIEQDIEEIKKHEKQDLEMFRHIQEMNKLQCQSMVCIMNHMIDGNNVSKMQETRDNIQNILLQI